MNQEDLLFAQTHEWVHVQEQGSEQVATVGLSAVAIEALTDLVYYGFAVGGRFCFVG